MDLSKEFVLMCQKAVEIQKDWKPQPYDFFWDTFGESIEKGWEFIVGKPDDYSEPFEKEKSYIFLPRQDQLQEILGKTIQFVNDQYFGWMANWVVSNDLYLEEWYPQSTEQILLAALMKEKFNKTWDADKKEWLVN